MRSEAIRRIEYGVGIFLSILCLILLGIRAAHAGALWRDECDSVATATMPSFSELLRYFQFDSFPLLFHLALRGYIVLFGNSNGSLRILGALVGVALLLVAWWSANRLHGDAPVVTLTLAALNPTFLTWGTTVRGYGIGGVLIMFAFAATANFLVRPTIHNGLIMGIAFVAAVQCLVTNTVLVFAICLSALAVCFARGDRTATLIVVSALAVAALSFLPYVATYSKMGWHVLLQENESLAEWLNTFCDSLGLRSSAFAVAWLTLTLIAAIGWMLQRIKHAISPLATFASLTALFSLAGGLVFFKLLSYVPKEWYFLPFICLLAGALQLANSSVGVSTAVRIVRVLICLLALGGTWWWSWPKLIERQSNVDLIADWLGSQAKAGDLIVVSPWFLGVSFNRYYRGDAPWVTLPILNDLRIHRYDLLQEKMTEDDPLKDFKLRVEQTLRRGGRLYLVGRVAIGEGEQATVLPPAPRSQYGWHGLPYSNAWSEQTAEFLTAHAQSDVTMWQFGKRINPLEDIKLYEVEGWHD